MLPKSIEEDPRYAGRVESIDSASKIPLEWQKTPIEKFIRAENFGEKIEGTGTPELLIATCIEFRYALPIPRMFAYVLRRASGRLIGSEFSLAYILSAGVRHICLVGHNDCGMTKIEENKQRMIQALIDQGWYPDRATEFINTQAGRYQMKDELDGLEWEYKRLRRLFRNVEIAPLFVDLSNTHLYIPNWYFEHRDKHSFERDPNEVADEDILQMT
jgi:carbonic anhydrase